MLARSLLTALLISVVTSDDVTRIISGTEVQQGVYPQLVSIQTKDKHFCGGTILNRNFVLTAAHCIVSKNSTKIPKNVSIVSSTVNLTMKGRKYQATELIAHENFSTSNLVNDIALIKVQPPFQLQDGEEQIKTPPQFAAVPVGAKGTVVGWGRVSESDLSVHHLNQVEQVIIGHDECLELLHNDLYHFKISNVCSVGLTSHHGFCKGDSGGPVFVNGVQVGIVSWYTKHCGDGPQVYTRLSHYIDWIDNKTIERQLD